MEDKVSGLFSNTWPDYITLGVLPLFVFAFRAVQKRMRQRQLKRSALVIKQNARIARLERNQLTREDFDAFRQSLAEQHRDTNEKFDRIWQFLAGSDSR